MRNFDKEERAGIEEAAKTKESISMTDKITIDPLICTYCTYKMTDGACWKSLTPTVKNTCRYFNRKRVCLEDHNVSIYTERDGKGSIDLVETCAGCHGEIGHINCPNCKGKGAVISPTGKKLIEFIRQFG